MIPKIIHYCWFGKKEMPKVYLEFINEWKTLMPDYEFKCWTEDDIDINSIPFAATAYKAGNFAYVADYVRIYALYNEGGIYMDTDVKLQKPLDSYRLHDFFTSVEFAPKRSELYIIKNLLDENGFRKNRNNFVPIPGLGLFSALLGSIEKHPFIKDCLDFYNNNSYEAVFGKHITIPHVLAYNAEKYGFAYIDKNQKLDLNITIYKSTIFSSKLYANSESIAIHYCAASWVNKSFITKIKGLIYNISIVRKIIDMLFPKKIY